MGELTLYFDRCFGRRLPEALYRAKPPFKIEFHHSDRLHFPQDTPDDEWLAYVGSRGWIVLSHDRRFHTRAAETSAIKQHSIGCFYLWGAEVETWDKLRWFMRAVDQIVDAARTTERPFIYHLPKLPRLTKVPLP